MFVSGWFARSTLRLAAGLSALLVLLTAAAPASGQVASRVRVQVVDAAADRPLPDAAVEVAGGGTAWTDAEGRAVFRGIPEGTAVLRAHHPGFAPAETTVEVENGRPVDVAFRLQPRPVELEAVEVSVRGLPPGGRSVRMDEVGPEARSLEDVVEGVPGVTVVRRGGPGSPAVPTIRGSSGDQVLVLVDGVALNSPLTGEADLSQVDLAQVERVVVVPGARAGRFGPGALAGAILVETRSTGRSRVESAVEVGSLGVWAVRGTGTVRRPSGGWSVSAGAEWQRSDGAFEYPVPEVRGGGSSTRRNAAVRSVSGFLQGVLDTEAGPELRLRLHLRDAERGSPGTVVQPSLTGHHEQRRVGAVLQVEDGDATRGWDATVGADEHRALFVDPDPPFGPAYRSESRVRQVEARAEGRRAAGPLLLTAGVDGRYRGLESTTLAPGTPGGVGGAGAWLRGRWEAGSAEGPSVRVTGTLRGDLHDLLDGPALSPSLSVLLGRGGTTLEAAVGSSVSPPDLSDLFFQEGVLAEANPALAPERVRSEVSLELRQRLWGDGWRGSLALGAFRADVEGMILWLPDHRFVWSPRNLDVARRGLEADGELRVGILDPLRASVGWTRVRYDARALDGQVVYRPRVTADLGADLSLAGARWSARWRWVGARRTRPGTDLNRLPGYGHLDLGLSVPFSVDALAGSVELSVGNALDEPAALLVDYPVPGRTLSLRIRAGPAGP